MANFNAAVLTKKGLGLLAKAQTGQAGIEFTRAVAGNGSYDADERLTEKEALKDQRQEFPLDKLSVVNNSTASIRFTITNEQASGNLQEGYHVKEVGLYATDPDEGEILYAIATAVEDQWDYMPAYNSLMPAYITVEFYAEVSNAATVTIVCNGRFITAEEADEEFEKLRARIEDAETELVAIEEAIEGIGQVPDGVLTSADKGVENGVASLDERAHIPYEQLPAGTAAEGYTVSKNIEGTTTIFKFSFGRLTWEEAGGAGVGDKKGWVGTYEGWQSHGYFMDVLSAFRWAKARVVLDLDSLYARYAKTYAEYYASVFCSLNFQAYMKKAADGKSATLKVFSDSNLGASEAADVYFYTYALRDNDPDF